MEYLNVPLEIKTLDSGEFEGYGSTFGNVDLGGDVVVKGAFRESLAQYRKAGEWPQMFWMHKPDQIPGMWTDMREDSKGLFVKGQLLGTAVGNDTRILMKAKAVKRLSIGFSIDSPDDVEFRDEARLLKKINLWEVSPVSLAMNPKATIDAVKARLKERGTDLTEFKRKLEHWLREEGLSKSQSIAAASRALSCDVFDLSFGAMPRGENGDESGAMPDESRRDAGEANGDAERAAKALAEKLMVMSLRLPKLA